MSAELTIGTLAARTGVPVSSLRFYESEGLLRPRRSAGNQRRYPPEAVALVEFIQNARRAGLPVSLIATVLRAPAANPGGFNQQDFCDELCARMRALADVREDVEQITEICTRCQD